MVWTNGRITRNFGQTQVRRVWIVRLFERGIIHIDDNKCAWGQFLDVTRDNTQYGVYGTSAGIEVLILAGYSGDHEIISNAINLFSEAYKDPTCRFYKKGNMNNYKMAFWVELIEPGKKEIDEKNLLLDDLIKNKIVGQGWGNYYISRNNHDLKSKGFGHSLYPICP